ncbi:MAG: NADH-quinone oxidoreductase subunit J, partial [Chloroflexi bacterium]|nr:NADH-quinone oxidoreductase subunit J [Chloroflexota bacterium]
MLFQDTVFWILAVVAIGAALGVVLIKDLFRAALLLVVVFMA